MKIPRIPLPNEPVRADWAKDVVNCLRALRMSGGGRARVTQTPEGTTVFVAEVPRAREAGAVVGPWDVTFNGATASFTNCDWLIGPNTLLHADMTYTLAGANGEIYVAISVNTATGAITIIEGATKAAVTCQAQAENDPVAKRLLYRVRKSTTGTAPDQVVTCSISGDYRSMPFFGSYV